MKVKDLIQLRMLQLQFPIKMIKTLKLRRKLIESEPENIANKHTNIDSKSTTNNDSCQNRTVSEGFTSLVAGILFTLGAFLGLKKKDQD